jgi:hypothetical protein
MPARKKGGAKAKPRRRRRKLVRIDLVVEAQQKVIGRVGTFVEDAADMTMKGVLSPSAWLHRYAVMWRDLAGDLADITKRL